jgi:hypothetical protein
MAARAVAGEPLDDRVHARRHRPKAFEAALRFDLAHSGHGMSALQEHEVMTRHQAGETSVATTPR